MNESEVTAYLAAAPPASAWSSLLKIYVELLFFGAEEWTLRAMDSPQQVAMAWAQICQQEFPWRAGKTSSKALHEAVQQSQ